MKGIRRSIVITGASSGIGRATALEFARNGDYLTLVARRKEALEELATECVRVGGKAIAVPLDVRNEEEVYKMAQQAQQTYGALDVWVNNAAVAMMGPFEETPMEDIKRLLDINVHGYLYGARAALRYFRKQGSGILVNVSSVVGLTGQPFSIAYTTSKAAIRGMSLCLQQEYAEEENIHICSVLPATVDTPLFQSAANYMGRAIKAMEPIVDAQQVADEIVRLVDHPKPEVIVGGMGIQAALLKQFAPGVFAKLYRKQVQSHHFTEDQAEASKGNLYEPHQGDVSIDGGWLGGRSSRAVTMQVRNIRWLGTAVVTGAIVGTAALLMRTSSR
jgi:short-subunit dehydrogenase